MLRGMEGDTERAEGSTSQAGDAAEAGDGWSALLFLAATSASQSDSCCSLDELTVNGETSGGRGLLLLLLAIALLTDNIYSTQLLRSVPQSPTAQRSSPSCLVQCSEALRRLSTADRACGSLQVQRTSYEVVCCVCGVWFPLECCRMCGKWSS